jgi:hypothetical protein
MFNDAMGAIQSASIKLNHTLRDSIIDKSTIEFYDFQDAIGEIEEGV